MFFEGFAEVGGVFEAEGVGDFFDGMVGEDELAFGFEDETFGDEMFGGAAHETLGNGGEVARGDVEGSGVVADGVGLAVLLFEEGGELVEKVEVGVNGRFRLPYHSILHLL